MFQLLWEIVGHVRDTNRRVRETERLARDTNQRVRCIERLAQENIDLTQTQGADMALALADIKSQLDAEEDAIQKVVVLQGNLTQQVADLQAEIAAGGDQDTLKAISDEIAAHVAELGNIAAPPTPAPAPAPTPAP